MKTKHWIVLGGIVIGGLIIWGIVHRMTSGIPVETAVVARGPIHQFIDERAKTRLPEIHLITMPAAGRIEAITVTEGMPVEKGQIVARIVQRDLELAVNRATAAVQRLDAAIRKNADVTVEETAFTQAQHFVDSMNPVVEAAESRKISGKAKYDYAEANFGRISQAKNAGAATQDDLEKALLERIQSQVDYQQDVLVHASMVALKAATDLLPTMVRQFIDRKQLTEDELLKQKAEAEALLQEILQNQERGTLHSTVDGIVLKRPIHNERFLQAGDTLLEIGRLEDLEIEADVLSLDVVSAQVGDPVEIYGPAIGQPTAKGQVTRIYPAGFTKVSSLGVEQQRVKVIIRMDPEDHKRLVGPDGLGVGYRVRVKILTAEKPDAMTVPRSALFRDSQGNWQVYAVRDGRAELQPVTIGLINDESVEILTGLTKGQQVILAPESTLTNGIRVTPTKRGHSTFSLCPTAVALNPAIVV